MTPNLLRIGTRKSLLAQTQSRWVADQIRRHHPGLSIELVPINTSGDILPSPLPAGRQAPPLPKGRGPTPSEMSAFSLQGEGARRADEGGGLKAMFTKEIEDALLENRIDLAVHSMKDMPAELPTGLVIGAVPPREDPRDVWIARNGRPFKEVKRGATIGTGAVRRQAQLRHHRPDLTIVPLRGNVDTRLRKLKEGVTPAEAGVQSTGLDSGIRRNDEAIALDGLVLALAGLRRLGREKEVTEILSSEILLPAVGQGALAIEINLKDEKNLAPYLQVIHDPDSYQAILAERAFLKTLGGSCQTPIAAYAQIMHNQLTINGMVASPDGHSLFQESMKGAPDQAVALGTQLAKKLMQHGLI